MNEIVELDGISFDCGWYADENDHGDQYVVLEAVYINDQDLTGIIKDEYWNKLEKLLAKQLDDNRR